MDHMLPARAGDSQGSFDIAERLGDLVRDRLGAFPVIVPAALARNFQAVADRNRLRIVKLAQLTLTLPQGHEKRGLGHRVPPTLSIQPMVCG